MGRKKQSVKWESALDRYIRLQGNKLSEKFEKKYKTNFSEMQIRMLLDTQIKYKAQFKNKTEATKYLKEGVEGIFDPEKTELRKAKKEAFEVGGFWSPNKLIELNKKIDAFNLISTHKDINVEYVAENFSYDITRATITSYYEIKNSDKILAEVTVSINNESPTSTWMFLPKEALL